MQTGKANPQWNYASASAINGEAKMKELIAGGHSLYATLDVYDNFMSLGNGIFMAPAGAKKGGHAVALVAFGQAGSTPYWVCQNSWATRWGENGYGKIKRGSNVAGIEDRAYYFRVWTTGGAIPPCFDGSSTGLRTSSGDITCSQAKTGPFGNLCENSQWGPTVKAACPVTCGGCKGGMGSADDWGKKKPSPSPTPSPTPSPSPTPTPTPTPTSGRRRSGSRRRSSRRRSSRRRSSRRRSRRRRRSDEKAS